MFKWLFLYSACRVLSNNNSASANSTPVSLGWQRALHHHLPYCVCTQSWMQLENRHGFLLQRRLQSGAGLVHSEVMKWSRSFRMNPIQNQKKLWHKQKSQKLVWCLIIVWAGHRLRLLRLSLLINSTWIITGYKSPGTRPWENSVFNHPYPPSPPASLSFHYQGSKMGRLGIVFLHPENIQEK